MKRTFLVTDKVTLMGGHGFSITVNGCRKGRWIDNGPVQSKTDVTRIVNELLGFLRADDRWKIKIKRVTK